MQSEALHKRMSSDRVFYLAGSRGEQPRGRIGGGARSVGAGAPSEASDLRKHRENRRVSDDRSGSSVGRFVALYPGNTPPHVAAA